MLCIVGEIKDGILQIGDTTVPVYSPETKTKVLDVLFYENAQVTVPDVEVISQCYYQFCLLAVVLRRLHDTT